MSITPAIHTDYIVPIATCIYLPSVREREILFSFFLSFILLVIQTLLVRLLNHLTRDIKYIVRLFSKSIKKKVYNYIINNNNSETKDFSLESNI